MARAVRGNGSDSETRAALLDAAEALMVDEGYAAVTTRRVASEAGVNNGLVHYYFGTLEELFVEVFRRATARGEQEHAAATENETDQPLWRAWEMARDFSNNALMNEFVALANHRKAIQTEIAAYWLRFRKQQVDELGGILEEHGLDTEAWPAESVLLLMVAAARFLHIEDAFGVDLGHAETVAMIERQLRALEGERHP
jgi:AcrR family transcriptional regulator